MSQTRPTVNAKHAAQLEAAATERDVQPEKLLSELLESALDGLAREDEARGGELLAALLLRGVPGLAYPATHDGDGTPEAAEEARILDEISSELSSLPSPSVSAELSEPT